MIIISSIAQSKREDNYNNYIHRERTDTRVLAWRDGDMTFVYISELVTGDIVKITPGMWIPADMLLIEVDELCNITTAESYYTGEPCSMPKRTFSDCIKQRDDIIAGGKKDSISRNDVCSPVLVTGTKVLSGKGKAIVLLVDEFSVAERVKRLCQDMGEFCQLQMKVENIVGNLRKIVLGAAAIIFLVLTIKFFIERVRTDTLSEGAQYMQFIDIFMTIAALLIVAAPEGLSLAVTSAMAHSINTLRYNRILVKKLQDLEYLGAVNSICCSITGSTEDYKTLKDAGIRLRIVTEGDKKKVETITKELTSIESGTEENVCMTGNEFLELVGDIVCKRCKTKDCDCPTTKQAALKSGREMRVDEIANFDAFARVSDQLHVLTKSHSDAKTALVVGLKQRGDTAAVTADGTDDISVLRKADVRLALESSSEIVKEAAGIVLLANRLNTLVEAVMWSRSIYDNIRKYLQYQLTATLAVVSINLVSAFTCSQPLFLPLNLFWISMLFKMSGFVALEHDEPSREVLKRKPYNINEDIISGMMLKQILGQALFQLVFLMGVAFSVLDSKSSHVYQSIVLSLTFLMCQILNCFNCRKIHGEINVFSGLSIWLVLPGILYLVISLWPLYKITGLFHSIVVICLASLTLIWPVIMKLHSRTRKLSKAHEKTE